MKTADSTKNAVFYPVRRSSMVLTGLFVSVIDYAKMQMVIYLFVINGKQSHA
jgi:hypothetical protein